MAGRTALILRAHIAGTNGKGSTAAFLESILRRAGFRTGLNTSPHLEKINERIRVNGEEISDEAFAETFTRIQALNEELLAAGKLRAHPTYFECVTAMAFEYFARARVEFGVFEVGLGGRLDATNILTPVVSIITRVDFDHENFLGHSLAEIAAEKAGILKPSVPVVVAEQRPEALEVIRARARELGCPVIETAAAFRIEKEWMENGCSRARVTEVESGWPLELAPRLPGKFQIQNSLNAVAAARYLQKRGYRISDDAITQGIAEAVWPGRLEKLQTEPGCLSGWRAQSFGGERACGLPGAEPRGRKIWLVFGALRDKAVDEIAGVLFPHAAEVIFTAAAHHARDFRRPAGGNHVASRRAFHDCSRRGSRARICARPGRCARRRHRRRVALPCRATAPLLEKSRAGRRALKNTVEYRGSGSDTVFPDTLNIDGEEKFKGTEAREKRDARRDEFGARARSSASSWARLPIGRRWSTPSRTLTELACRTKRAWFLRIARRTCFLNTRRARRSAALK